MADVTSELPIRSQLPGQVLPDDVIVKLGDGTNPTTQFLGIDTSGRITVKLDDGAGNAVTSQVNGAQRALDVGINVAGVQIDPRQIRALTSADIVTAAQGTAAATHAGYWWTRLTDGTNDSTMAPASTAATATQAALVVALSPNSPLPTGSNVIGSVNQGTSPWITKDQADGSVAPGTAGSFSQLAGGVYTSAGITLTTGQQAALQVDSAGSLFVDLKTALPAGANNIGSVNQGTSPWITSDLADGSVSGGAAGSKSLLGGLIFNSSAPTLTTGQQASLQGDSSGNLKVNIAAGTLDVGIADKTAFTYGTTIFQPVGGVFQDTAPTLTAGQSGAARLTTNRAVHTNLRTSGGTEITAQANGSQEALDVGINVAGVQIDPRAIRALTSADVVTSNQGTANTAANAWPTKITDGTNTAAVKAASTAAGATDPALVVALSPNSPLPAGTNLLGAVNLDIGGTAVSSTNPVPVSISSAPLGTPVNNYNTASAIVAGATSNHDYTITSSKTFQGKKIWASSSSIMKIEVQTSPDGTTFTSFWVGFNSTANPNITIDMDQMVFLDSGVGAKIRVIRTNLDPLKAVNLYSTISGTEV